MPAATTSPSNPFMKQLVSSDRNARDRALSSLRTYLKRTKPFSSLELLKLWKGLFYCMWMSDKPRNQQQLSRDLAGLVDVLASANFLGFIDAFWQTMANEWNAIDRLRMDKFLYLVRCYVNKGFEYVGRGQWKNKELFDSYLESLEAIPLNARDGKIPNGIRYHVLDIYVDELDKVDNTRTAPLDSLLKPIRTLGKASPTKAVRKKVEEALEDERLGDWSRTDWSQPEADEDSEGSGQTKSHKTIDQDGEMEEDDDAFGGFDE